MADQLSHAEAILIPQVAGAMARTANSTRVGRPSASCKRSDRFQRNVPMHAR